MKRTLQELFVGACIAALLGAGYLIAQTTSTPVFIDKTKASQAVVPYGWSAIHAPAANTQATTTQGARQGFRHVATGMYAQLVAGAVAPAAVQLSVILRDGPSGTGTVLWQGVVALPATAGAAAPSVQVPDLFIQGTPGNAMTLEFSATGGANTVESVTLTGYDTAS
jgi:hypothetical protein